MEKDRTVNDSSDPRGALLDRLDLAINSLGLTTIMWVVLFAEKLAWRHENANETITNRTRLNAQ